MTTLSSKERKSKGARLCDFCLHLIAAGEAHRAEAIADGGRCYTYRSHLRCYEAMGVLAKTLRPYEPIEPAWWWDTEALVWAFDAPGGQPLPAWLEKRLEKAS